MKRKLISSVVTALVLLLQNAPGQTWSATTAPAQDWRSLASSADGSRLTALAFISRVYTSTNAGATWDTNLSQFSSLACTCIASSADGDRLLVGTISDALYTSADAGRTWRSNSAPVHTWSAVASSADGTKLVAGSGGPIYTSPDSGATWVEHYVPVTDDYPYFVWNEIACSADGSRLAAAGSMSMNWSLGHGGGLIYTSSNSGEFWQPSSAPNTNWCSIACSADGSRLLAAAFNDLEYPHNAALFISADSGTTWSMCQAPETGKLQAHVSVACSADGMTMVAAAAGFASLGYIVVSTNSGVTWSSNSTPTGTWIAVCSSADGGRLFAALDNGPIYTRTAIRQPSLSISARAREAILSWIVPSADFQLQESANPAALNWNDVAEIPALTNLQMQVTRPLLPGSCYYRLQAR